MSSIQLKITGYGTLQFPSYCDTGFCFQILTTTHMPSIGPVHFLLKMRLVPARPEILSKQSPGPILKHENMLYAAGMEITGATWASPVSDAVYNVITKSISNDDLTN